MEYFRKALGSSSGPGLFSRLKLRRVEMDDSTWQGYLDRRTASSSLVSKEGTFNFRDSDKWVVKWVRTQDRYFRIRITSLTPSEWATGKIIRKQLDWLPAPLELGEAVAEMWQELPIPSSEQFSPGVQGCSTYCSLCQSAISILDHTSYLTLVQAVEKFHLYHYGRSWSPTVAVPRQGEAREQRNIKMRATIARLQFLVEYAKGLESEGADFLRRLSIF